LSTLTKFLIVLVCIFSVFLSGIVAMYVANAENFRKTADDNNRKWQSARNTQESAVRASEQAKKDIDAAKAELGADIKRLDETKTKLTGELEDAKRLNAELQQRLMSMDDKLAAANATVQQQSKLHMDAQQKAEALEAERTKREKELADTSQALVENVATIAQLKDQLHQLTQENQDLGGRLNQYLAQYGKIVAKPPTTVAPGSPVARPVQPIAAQMTKNIALNGQVTAAQDGLVEISIGSAAGVRQDMEFHIVRGDQYVARIKIMEVWPDRSVGKLNLDKPGMQPQVSDKVTTNL
jgi:predicted  nucleic acid-binding Zn-ribbon protein